MGTFFLKFDVSAYYSLSAPIIEALVEGVVVSAQAVTAHTGFGINSFEFAFDFSNTYPSSLSLRFNDGFAEPGRNIKIENVFINGQQVDSTYISLLTILLGQSGNLNTNALQYLFGIVEPTPGDLGVGSGGPPTHSGTSGDDNITGTSGNDVINGSFGNDNIFGGGGADIIDGGDGDDVIYGGDGDDIIEGGDGDDIIHGGNGNDAISGGTGSDLIFGGPGNDIIIGGPGVDTIFGGAGNDIIYGSADRDVLIGDSGNDVINGGGGDDAIFGDDGDDIMYGGDGNDVIFDFSGNNYFFGDDGDDVMLGGTGIDTMHGGNGNDQIHGDDNNDFIYGDDGDDFITGGAGNDTIEGGAGADLIFGDAGNDIIDGGDDDDAIYGDAGNDTISGGAGNDALIGGAGADILDGGDGDDNIYGHSLSNTQIYNVLYNNPGLFYSEYTNSFYQLINSNVDAATAGSQASAAMLSGVAGHLVSITSAAENNFVTALAGGNAVWIGASDSATEGQWIWNTGPEAGLQFWQGNAAGSPTYSFYNNWAGSEPNNGGGNSDAAVLETSGQWQDRSGAETHYYVIEWEGIKFSDDNAIDTLMGGDGNDILFGAGGNDRLSGDAGDDKLFGGNGNDILYGGAGSDVLLGEAGDDVLYGHSLDQAAIDAVLLANPGVVFNLETGSFYQFITVPLTWALANTAAQAAILNGAAGHLANVTSQAEADYLYNLILPSGDRIWLGGTDQAVEDTWLWTGGPEDGIQFSQGNTPVNNMFTFWGTGQPNNLGGNQNFLTIWMSSQPDHWDDRDNVDTFNYVIEWDSGLMADDNASDFLSGGAGNDTLYGFGGDDILDGGADNDILIGGAGNDTLIGGAGMDSLFGGTGIDTVTYASAAAGATVNLLTNFAANDGDGGTDRLFDIENIIGSAFNDILTGDAGNNVIDGGAGNDTIDGGAGNDTLIGGSGTDTVTYASAGSGVMVSLMLATPQNTGGAGTDTLSGFENLTGSAFNDTLEGSTGNNVLDGGAGTDTLTYANAIAGVTVSLAVAGAQATGGSGTDTISNFENLTGSGFNDTLEGNSGNNILVGGAGTDILSYTNAASGVTVSLAIATAQNTVGAGIDTVSGFENLLGSGFADILTGDAGANVIDGGAGDDIIEGGAGNDTLNGGLGSDTASYANAASAVTITLASVTAQNTVGAGTDTLTGFENLLGSAFNDTLTGDGGDNIIDGGNGNDTITGGSGADTLIGGAGNDTFNLANGDFASGESIDGGANTDTIVFTNTMTVDFSAGTLSNLETMTGSANGDTVTMTALQWVNFTTINLGTGTDRMNVVASGDISAIATPTLTSIEDGYLIGTALADSVTLTGAQLDAILIGAGIIDLGAGSDTINITSTSADLNTMGITDSMILNLETISAALAGAGVTITLYGQTEGFTIIGSGFNDTVESGVGNDIITGGAGTDTITFAHALGGVNVSLAITIAQNTVNQGIDTITGFENLIGSDFADILTGDAGANTINGGAGNDWIEGGAGNDILIGGTGIDTISYANAASAVTVNLATSTATGGAGTDTISGFENIVGSAFNDTLTGDANANVIEGGLGNDIMNGGSGNDTVSYSSATSAVTVNLATATAQNTVGAGTDTLSNFQNLLGSIYNDTLTGDNNANGLLGGRGADTINGGGGNDYILGNNLTQAEIAAILVANPGISYSYDTGNFYMLVSTSSTFAQAYADTTMINGVTGHLATITSATENTFVQSVASGNTVWIGASDKISEGAWLWVGGPEAGQQFWQGTSGGSAQNSFYTNWQGGQPDNAGTLADGATMGASGTWSDTPTGTTSYYVLEWEGWQFNDDNAVDTLSGGTGNDIIFGGGGNDIINGDDGNDRLFGGAGNDTINGGNNDDYIADWEGNNIIDGGAGNDIIDARYYGNIPNKQDQINAILAANPNLKYLADTGNFYEYIATTYSWANANTNAATHVINGVAGHIATSTSAAENLFLDGVSGTANIWLGGTDSGTEGAWLWTGDGSEGGQQFWSGNQTGSAQNGFYTNWTSGQPNAGNADEDYLGMTGSNGLWTDERAGATARSYVVEWEGSQLLLTPPPAPIAGNSILNGGSGNDIIYSGDGNDILNGGSGNDTLYGSGGDVLNGGDNNDFLYSFSTTPDAAQAILDANPGLVYSAETGNFYRYVDTLVSATNAFTLSAAAFINGIAGHLVTITSAQENAFMFSLTSGQTWIGAIDVGNVDNWQWNAGPEAGQQFWSGGIGGTALMYANWIPGSEPNNTAPAGGGTVANARMNENGEWLDTNDAGTLYRYVIEWEGSNLLSGSATVGATLNGQNGLDNLYGSSAADVFLFEAASAFNDVDVIHGFDMNDKDILNLDDLISSYNPLTKSIADFVMISDGTQTDSYAASIQNYDPLLYYRLGESSGTTAVDAMGVLNGTYVNAPTFSQAAFKTGLSDTSVDFAGGGSTANNEYVRVTDNAAFDLNNATFIAWFRSDTNSATMQTVMSKDGTTGGQFNIGVTTNDGDIVGMLQNGTGGAINFDINQSVALNTWYMLTFAFSTSSGVEIYLNGTSIYTNAGFTTALASNYDFIIGASNTAGNTTMANYFNGRIDDVAVFDTRLEDATITNIYNAGINAVNGTFADGVYVSTGGTANYYSAATRIADFQDTFNIDDAVTMYANGNIIV